MTCRMHAIERILRPFLYAAVGPQGLDKSGSTAQSVYSIAYYMRMHSVFFEHLARASVGMDMHADLPKPLQKMLKTICTSRWISTELTCSQLWELLMFPASGELLRYIRDKYCDQYLEQEWTNLLREASTPGNDDVPSHLILCFVVVANCSTCGSSNRCDQLVAFLCSAHHRVNICWGAALYDTHLMWASFIDGRSATHRKDAETHSTRMLELVVFERNVYKKLASLRGDLWKEAFPDLHAVVQSEAKRAVVQQTNPNYTENSFTTHFDERMKKGVEETQVKAEKYMCNQLNCRGWSPVLLTDPFLAPHVAAAMLQALFPEVYEQGKSRFKQLPDTGRDVISPWTPECEMFAWPGKTYAQLRSDIFTCWHATEAEHVIKAYGMRHEKVKEDLVELARDGLRKIIHSNPKWMPGVGVRYYYDDFFVLCPALADLLEFHFSYIPIATTLIEQCFSAWLPATDVNQTMDTMSDNMKFAFNVKSQHHRHNMRLTANNVQRTDLKDGEALVEWEELENNSGAEEEEVGKRNKRRSDLRSAPNIVSYLKTLQKLSEDVTTLHNERQRDPEAQSVTRKSLNCNGCGLKKKEQLRNLPALNGETAANKKKAVRLEKLGRMIRQYNSSVITGSSKLAALYKDPFVSAAKNSKDWKVDDKKNYLIANYKRPGSDELFFPVKIIKKTSLSPRDDDDDDYVTLVDMLLECWDVLAVKEDELPGIMASWAKQKN